MLRTEVLAYREQTLCLWVKIFMEFLLFKSQTVMFNICELITLIQSLKIVEIV